MPGLRQALCLVLTVALIWGGTIANVHAVPSAVEPHAGVHVTADHHHAHPVQSPASDPDCFAYCLEIAAQPYVKSDASAAPDGLAPYRAVPSPRPVWEVSPRKAADDPPEWATGPPLPSIRSGAHRIVRANARLRI